jgi:hypothetical protein
MKWTIIWLVLLVGIIAGGITPAMALTGNETTLSFSDLNWVSHSDLEFYGLYPNGTWVSLGIWNTTSSALVLQPGVYSVVVHPSGIARLTDPVTFLQDGFAWIQTNAFAATFIIILVGLFAAILSSGEKRRQR